MQRTLERIVAAAALVLLAPLFIGVAILVRLTSPGSVFHPAERVGRHGQSFRVLKFRTMRENSGGQPRLTLGRDSRITGLGHHLRRWKLDELPQLINVVRGEMAFVGPRPEDPKYVALYSDEERNVLDVLPGITSPASIAYRNEFELLDRPDWEEHYVNVVMRDKLRRDLDYLARRSAFSDLGVILQTLGAISAKRQESTDDHAPEPR